ncbi:MAG: TIGR01906 family membrane protein [Defluviitaleaceae bacterium]|nr:TIGR01906 family membrane protein [Defluviitaleaceae bacterium]MCL2835641.1 TIGR01906 family membrane protein [Defluviitaleaceae bacterium]
MKIARIVAGALNALCLAVFLLAVSIQVPSLNMWFYRYQFNKNQTYAVLRMDEESLHNVARSLIDYLRGDLDSLHGVRAVVNGQERQFFSGDVNNDEIGHMEDVLELFLIGLLARDIAGWGFLATLAVCILLGRKEAVPQLLALWRGFALFCLTAFAVLGGLIALNFNRAFTIFHEMFFVDNWTFNPRSSLMINMLPNQFFMDIAAFIIIMFVSFLIITVILTTVLRRMLLKNAG